MHRSTILLCRWLGAAAISTATAALGTASVFAPTTSAAAAAVDAPACPGASLVVWLDTDGNGAAGSTYYDLELTNLSGHTCTLSGYPGVSAIGLDNRQIGAAASRNDAHKSQTVTLATGVSAVAMLQIVDAENFPVMTCRPTAAAGLRVYPPNQLAAKTIPFPFRACSAGGDVFLHVESVEK